MPPIQILSVEERLETLQQEIQRLGGEIKSPAEEAILDFMLLALNEIAILHQRIDAIPPKNWTL